MVPKQVRLKCLMCGHEYTGMYDHDNVTERSCPKCRSNSIRRLPGTKAADK